jgi:hypothetical protein
MILDLSRGEKRHGKKGTRRRGDTEKKKQEKQIGKIRKAGGNSPPLSTD